MLGGILLFDERQLKNLLLFLDRVEYKGLKEVQAIREIIDILSYATENKLEDSAEENATPKD